jgi:hypothetical protein
MLNKIWQGWGHRVGTRRIQNTMGQFLAELMHYLRGNINYLSLTKAYRSKLWKRLQNNILTC